MGKFVYILALLVALVASVQGSAFKRALLETSSEDQIADEVAGAFGRLWGGACMKDEDCVPYLSHCERDSTLALVGQCHLDWYIWLIAGVLALLLVVSCLACICLPCCCLYTCCSAILDCLCCCCRNKGYSPAGRG